MRKFPVSENERRRCLEANPADGAVHPPGSWGKGQRDLCLRRRGFFISPFPPLSFQIHALKRNRTFPSAGIQYREAAVGRSRQEEDQARIRTQRAPSWNSQEDVTSYITLYTLFLSLSSKLVRSSRPLTSVEIKFWRVSPTRIGLDPCVS